MFIIPDVNFTECFELSRGHPENIARVIDKEEDISKVVHVSAVCIVVEMDIWLPYL